MTRLIATLLTLLIAAPVAFAADDAEKDGRKANRLISEASPYLRQHAYNPVDWYPWGKEAFEKAKKENKPVFLSVGYSTCHWCHVMARESFQNDDIAKILNENFISIKVDRERRPSVDETYMLATELISQRGGWPNTVFMTPDRKPFFGGTYFPPEHFTQLIGQVATLWQTDRGTLESDAHRVSVVISTVMTQRVEAAALTPAALKKISEEILKEHDVFNGGFQTAPKFPQEALLLFLLRLAEVDGDKTAREAALLSLDNMIRGGINDQIGGGFHRYAVDAEWRVPHFEKMLYNQALIPKALVRAYRLSGDERYATAARRTLDYVLADLTDKTGGFYSARDAESDGGEGRFYVWTGETLRKALGLKDALFAETVFGVAEGANFQNGLSVLYLAGSRDELAKKTKLTPEAFSAKLDDVRKRLFEAREARSAPHRDEKIITAWNGMMIAAFAEAADTLNEPRYRDAAIKAGTFLWETMRQPSGLKRAYFEGKVALDARQDDYAYAALGFIGLYDLTGSEDWLNRAEELSHDMVAKFRDDTSGDYYMTAAVETFGRSKARTDGGMPAGNSVALEVFAKLTERSRNPEHRRRGDALLAALSGLGMQSGVSSGYLLMAGDHMARGGIGPDRFLAKGVVRAKGRYDRASGKLVVSLNVADGWHVNADKPLEDFFIPTALKIKDVDTAITYPKAERRKLGFHDKELALYEGKVEISAKVSDFDGPTIPAELTLQACSDEICLEPQTVMLTVPNLAGKGS